MVPWGSGQSPRFSWLPGYRPRFLGRVPGPGPGADAATSGVSVEYVAGDMRQIPWTGRFDRVLSWSTAFGYFDDATNRGVLDGIAQCLGRPGGRLADDLDNLPSFLAS